MTIHDNSIIRLLLVKSIPMSFNKNINRSFVFSTWVFLHWLSIVDIDVWFKNPDVSGLPKLNVSYSQCYQYYCFRLALGMFFLRQSSQFHLESWCWWDCKWSRKRGLSISCIRRRMNINLTKPSHLITPGVLQYCTSIRDYPQEKRRSMCFLGYVLLSRVYGQTTKATQSNFDEIWF